MLDKQRKVLRILKAWHLIEFFQPYDLERNESSVQITWDELTRCGDALLPWLNGEARRRLKIREQEVRYTVYLGLFRKAQVNLISERIFGCEADPVKRIDLEQRLNSEGITCFAKLGLDTDGMPNFKGMSVSTLPWALGLLEEEDLQNLSHETYRAHCRLLEEELDRIFLKLPDTDSNGKPTLCAAALITLLKTLYRWAGFEPNSDFVIQLDWRESGKKYKKLVHKDSPQPREAPEDGDASRGEESEDEESNEQILPILNSFYIEDIERAMLSLCKGEDCGALIKYLSIEGLKHPDLYTQDGLKCITRNLAPEAMPQGRWPADPGHDMSLMQQFAINTTVLELRNSGLLSVNGPPGTGKTTLLRDLVAHNLVERAKAMSEYEKVDDTLDEKGFPRRSLGGFEMVVSSSNNNAVENISRELPLQKALGDEFQGLDYLKPVANQVNAKKKAGKYRAMEAKQQCWGMISASLGKLENRREFVDRIFFEAHFEKGSDIESRRPQEYNFLNLWRWRKVNQHTSFAQARRNFKEILKKSETQQAELQNLAQLALFISQTSEKQFLARYRKVLSESEGHFDKALMGLNEIEQQLEIVNEQLDIQELKLEALGKRKPSILLRLFQRRRYAEYQNTVLEYQAEKIRIKKQRILLVQRRLEKSHALEDLEKIKQRVKKEIVKARTEYNQKADRLKQLRSSYPEIVLPDIGHRIEDSNLQMRAFWQNESINRLRSELFTAAIDLHKAWLNEALAIGTFRKIMLDMAGFLKHPSVFDNITERWRSLFLVVPVISTTFASLGRMFNGVSGSELGWLMIDEAGQAIPQAAVGGIWRARRVIIVGDPLQIEPVFNTPPRLVKHICESELGDEADDWNPVLWSVQQIADRSNPYGCFLDVGNEPVWIGIPLWVHRRCTEPMFSLANRIAYDNRMIQGVKTKQGWHRFRNDNFENRWVTSVGYCSVKQHKTELENDTLSLLGELLRTGYNLSSIYIITPFKAVKRGLIHAVAGQPLESFQTGEIKLKAEELKRWRNNHIGTVHTFQGKENHIVILVLGCDPVNQGGAIWASAKPNLLNVALTRAKRKIFVVGDPRVWQDKSYFQELANTIPIVGE